MLTGETNWVTTPVYPDMLKHRVGVMAWCAVNFFLILFFGIEEIS